MTAEKAKKLTVENKEGKREIAQLRREEKKRYKQTIRNLNRIIKNNANKGLSTLAYAETHTPESIEKLKAHYENLGYQFKHSINGGFYDGTKLYTIHVSWDKN